MQPTATQKSISAAGTIGTCRSWTPSVHISDFAEIFEWMPQNVHKKCGVVQTATTQSWFFPHSNKMTVIFVFGHQKLVTGLMEWWTCRPLDCMIFVSIHFLPSLRTLSSPHLQQKTFPYSCLRWHLALALVLESSRHYLDGWKTPALRSPKETHW